MQIAKSEYRKINKLSASDIKLFEKDRNKFYRTKILGERQEDLTSSAIVLGTLVDFILSECRGSLDEFDRRFDEKFKLLSVKKGSGQMFLLVDELFKLTLRDMDEEGNITSSFSTRFEEAFDKIQSQDKFKGKKVEWALEQFRNSDEEIYFQECLSSIGKYVVDQSMLEKAKSVVERVIQDENINWLFNGAQELDNLGKTVIEFEYLGMECKCEIDDLSIDHLNKKIIITEIKTSYDIEDSFEYTYLKRRYDLAASFYWIAVNQEFRENQGLNDYDIEFQFLAVDTSKEKLRPLIYKLSKIDIDNSINGFTLKTGHYYKGLIELINEIKWCNEQSQWSISKIAYENNSILNLEINYDSTEK